MEFSSGGGYLQVEEWMLPGLSRQSEQMCPQRRPGRFAGEFGDDLVGLAIEHLNDLGANQLLVRLPPNRGGIDYKESHAREAEEVRR